MNGYAKVNAQALLKDLVPSSVRQNEEEITEILREIIYEAKKKTKFYDDQFKNFLQNFGLPHSFQKLVTKDIS